MHVDITADEALQLLEGKIPGSLTGKLYMFKGDLITQVSGGISIRDKFVSREQIKSALKNLNQRVVISWELANAIDRYQRGCGLTERHKKEILTLIEPVDLLGERCYLRDKGYLYGEALYITEEDLKLWLSICS